MTPWLAAACLFAAELAACGVGCVRGGLLDRLVALELSTVIGVLALLALATASGRSFYYDVALTIALTSLTSTLAFTRFLEHWL